MKTHAWWALLSSVALLHAGVVVAGQSSAGSTQSSQTTTSSTTSKTKATPSVKVTVVKSTAVPWAKQATPQPAAAGSSTRTPAKPPAPPKPTTQRKTPPKPAATRPAKPRAARPAPPPNPDAASTPAPARTPDAGVPASTPAPEGIITVEGSIDAMDLQAAPPTLQVRLSFGPVWTMTLDPATTSIVDGGRLGTMDDVRVHDKVTVAYAPKNGQRLVKSLELKKPPIHTSGPSTGK